MEAKKKEEEIEYGGKIIDGKAELRTIVSEKWTVYIPRFLLAGIGVKPGDFVKIAIEPAIVDGKRVGEG
jgi:hypothetical protein